MNIIGYTFEADCHCVPCTLQRHATNPFAQTNPLGLTGDDCRDEADEHGLPLASTDREGNAVHPIFSTDEGGDTCGDCFTELR